MAKEKIAIIMGDHLGWETTRKTWEANLSQDDEYEFAFFNPEEYARSITNMTRRLKRLTSLSAALGGRKAAEDAIAQGYRKIVVAPSHFAAVLPRTKGVRYYVYGDATIRQIDALGYTRNQPNLYTLKGLIQYPIRAGYFYLYDNALGRHAARGNIFLCTSQWYAQGLITEHQVSSDQVKILPCAVDTNYWTPGQNVDPQEQLQIDRSQPDRLQIVFVGGDFERKGGHELLAVCQMPEFSDCQFHFVTRIAPQQTLQNAVFYTQMNPNSSELRDLVRSCDLFVLPTQGDCSSIAALEAAACGLPAIVSDIGGVAELVDDDHTGVVLRGSDPMEIAEAIRTYRDNRERLVAHGVAARQRVVQEFDNRVCLNRLKDVVTAS
jgi:glycosyltransferase involved in cell wall biosynthesis